MMSEGDRPRSSWQSWVRSSAARKAAAAEPAPPPPPPADDLDVELQWGAGAATAEPAPADDLDVELSWRGGAEPGADGDATAPVEAVVADDEHDDDHDEDDDHDGDAVFADDDGDDAHDGIADEGHEGELLPAVPLLPSIAGRVEALSGLLRSISMRVDGLTAVTDAYRANVTDRIDEYTETVLQLSRQSEQTLDEHRRASERSIGELRRSASDRSEALGRLVGRVEELATEVATLRELIEVMIDTMPASAEGSGALPLTRADFDDRIDTIADAVVARIDVGGLVDAVVARMEAAFEVVADPEPAPPPSAPSRPVRAGPIAAPAASADDLLDLPVAAEPEPPKRGRGRRKG